MDSFQPIGNVTANETDTAYALRAIGQSLSETESETIELRSSLQKLLNSDDNLEQTRSRISDIDNSIRYHENKSSPKDSIQNYSNLSVFTKMQCEDIQKAYQNLATKLTNTESTVQSLKLHFCNIQAKQDLKEKAVAFQKPDELNSSKSARADSKTRDVFENELKKVTKELDRYKEDLHIANNAKQKLKEENKSLMTQIELNHAARLNDSTRIEKLENAKNKCNRKVAEMKSQLDREVEVRQSLEKSHGSLMNRLQDMEQLIDQERAQVQKVESEYQSLKRDYVSLRSEVDDEHKLRINAEETLQQLQQEAEFSGGRVGELMSERNLIDSALVQWKKDYLSMETDLKQKQTLITELQEKCTKVSGESDKLRAALKESSSQIEKMQTEHSKEVETLHQQYNTALDKQREAVSPAAVEAEKKKARLLQEKIAELGCQMSDYERTQEADCVKLRDQLRQKEAEAKRAIKEREELRRVQEKSLNDKESLLAEVNKTVDQLSADRVKLEYALEETKLELMKVSQAREHQESENVRLMEEMSSMRIRQTATDQLQTHIVQLTEDKSHLTHENTLLQAKVKNLTESLENMGMTKTELSVLKRQSAAYEAQFTKLNTEMNCMKVNLQKSEALVKQYREKMDSLEDEGSAVRRMTDELRDVRKYKNELKLDVDRLHEENRNLRSALESASSELDSKVALINENERKRKYKNELKLDVDRLHEENRNLRSALESASSELDSKVALINENERKRTQVREQMRREEDDLVKSYEQKLEVLQSQHSRDRDLLLNKMKKEQSELKKSRDEALSRANESAQLAVELRNRLGELETDLNKQRHQAKTIKMTLENSQRQKHQISDLNEKLKVISEQFALSEKEKKQYMRQNLEQAKSITTFVTQITQLESELQALAKLNDETAGLAKKYEEITVAEREERSRAEQRYALLSNRCKELEDHLIDVTLNNSQMRVQQPHHHSESRSSPSPRNDHGARPLERDSLNGDRFSRKQTSSHSGNLFEVSSSNEEEVHQKESPLDSSTRSADLESERQRALDTTKRAKQMIQESRETMRKLKERMSLLEDEYPTSYDRNISTRIDHPSSVRPEKG